MNSRRDFLRGGVMTGGLVVASVLLETGCQEVLDEDRTVLDLLCEHGSVKFERRFLAGRNMAFVTSVGGVDDDPENRTFWIFFVDGEEIDLPVHRFVVPQGSVVEMALIRWIDV